MSSQTTWQSIIANTSATIRSWDVTSNGVTSPPNLIYQEFLSALVKCFLVILIGYIAAKLRLLNEREANGLEIFVRQFALPSLIFLTLASVELKSVNWGVIKCFAAAKVIVFIMVMIITISVSKAFNVGKAALYSIFCTQSNDFCLGLPIIKSLYQDFHPEFSHYLYLLALVQYLILNPFGFFLMEFQKRRNQHCVVDNSLVNVLGALVKCTLLNPIIVMTFLGILVNICWSHEVPTILRDFLNVLGAAFPAAALFSLGYSLVANSGILLGAQLVAPALLITTKILIMPLVNRFIMHLYLDATQLSEKGVYENFAFLYGTIPTAPTVYIFATQFGMETDVVASGMVVSTFLSAPLMFLSGSMNTVTTFTSSHLETDLTKAVMYSSILGAFCSLWVIGALVRMKKARCVTHRITFFLIAFQFVAALGGLFQFVTGPLHLIHIEHIMSLFGILSSHIWTALLAVNIAVLYGKSLCFCLYIEKYIKAFGCIICFVLIMPAVIIIRKDNTGTNFLYDGADAYLHVVVLVTCIFCIIFSLITLQWYSSNQQFRSTSPSYENLAVDASVTDSLIDSDMVIHNPASDDQDGITDTEEPSSFHVSDMRSQSAAQPFPTFCDANSKCLAKNKNLCAGIIKKHYLYMQKSRDQGIIFEFYEDRHQVMKHVALIILLFISMIISLIINFWKKFLLKEKLGICIELEFLNACLCNSLGVITFAVFGLDRNLVVNPCKWWLWQLFYGSETLVLPELQKLPVRTRNICNIFLIYHMKNCIHDIVKDKKVGTRIYPKVFCGNDLVNWLLKVGLSHSRLEAEEYGNHLLLGRIIEHIGQRYYFRDLPHLYVFSANC